MSSPSRILRQVRPLVPISALAASMFMAMALALAFEPKVTVTFLGGDVRYLTHLSTDKPVYRPGEVVRVRGVLLQANDHRPLPDDEPVSATIAIVGPGGDKVAEGSATSEKSVLGFAWTVPGDRAGGTYAVEVTYPHVGYPPARRAFDIRAYRVPRFKAQIEFPRKGYGSGDEVVALLQVERAEGGVPVGAKVTAIARVDGLEIHRGGATVDASGRATVSFRLPSTIARGEGTLAMVIADGGVVDTETKTIPILLQTIDLTLHPEGGALVGGLSNHVYMQVFTPDGKPADVEGEVVDEAGVTYSTFRTTHEGRGVFAFKPVAGRTYALRVAKPAGILKTFPLPAVESSGMTLHAISAAYGERSPVEVAVGDPAGGRRVITLARKETTLATAEVDLEPGVTRTVSLDPGPEADGVLIVTAWDPDGTPRAERLVFRRPKDVLKITVEPDRRAYAPGGTVSLKVTTRDAAGAPVGARIGLAVFDDAVLEMLEKREQPPRLPAMVLLENEVKDLADAHVYFDPSNPDAPAAVDLLLGTQGWRRFAYVNAAEFAAAQGDAGRRMLALYEAPVATVTEDEGGAFFPQMVPAAPGALAVRLEEEAGAPLQNRRKAAGPMPPSPVGQLASVEDIRPMKPMPAAPPVVEAPRAEDAEFLADRRERRAPDARRFVAKEAVQVRQDFQTVRLHAHARPPRVPGSPRSDFAETLYWNVALETDAKTGEATVAFALSDAVTSFRVAADGFTTAGQIGEGTRVFESVEPFYVEPKLPLEVTAGDVMKIPVAVVTAETGTGGPVQLAFIGGEGLSLPVPVTSVTSPGSRVRELVEIPVGAHDGSSSITIRAKSAGDEDEVTRGLTIRPAGFPHQESCAGLLEKDGRVRHEMVLPQDVSTGSLVTEVTLHPSPLASMTQSLQRLMVEPNGCFEQTSSTNYPLIMAQQYFQTHSGVDADLVRRSSELLTKGYERLKGYECKSGGFEWFGEDPGHEALTAFGLMQFRDLSRVQPIDETMFARTRDWMETRKDGQGGFRHERRALHTWMTAPEVADTYITWALQEAGSTGLETEVTRVRDSAGRSDNSFVKALGALVLLKAGQAPEAASLLDALAAKQSESGAVEGTSMTIVSNYGDDLRIETTALAVLAWINARSHAGSITRGIRYLSGACEGGRYGSTQSTMLALKAINAHETWIGGQREPGSVQLIVDGQPVGEPVLVGPKSQEAILLPGFASSLGAGSHVIELAMTGGSSLPYTMGLRYHSSLPASSPECRLHLATELVDGEIQEGAATEVQVVVENRTGATLPTPIAVIGLPGGLEPRHDQLKELVKKGTIAFWEVRGREVVLYWRELAANAKLSFPVSAVAAVPGSYRGPASRAYEYYADEFKHWVPGLAVTITPHANR